MRLFVACELPAELLDGLAETQAALRGSISGRFVAPDSFHVTLAFLGEVKSYRVPELCAALDEACATHTAFEAQLAELGMFGRRKKAALWQGFANKEPFAALAASVRAALKREGFTFDDKTFLPHVTLMRAADVSEGALPMPIITSGRVEAVTLFKSDLSGQRPTYEPLHQVHLLIA